MSTTRLPEFEPVAMTDEDRDAVFNALPDRLPGFMKLWGWLHFAKDIEAKAHEKNADQMRAYGLAVWKAAIESLIAELEPAAEAHREAAREETDQRCKEWHAATAASYTTVVELARSLPLPEQGGPQ